jgi:hypothetical protein
MAIESAVVFRKVVRIACLVPIAGLLLGSVATAQLPITFTPGNPPPITAGSVLPFNHGNTGTWSQIYSMKIAPNGNILFMDSSVSNLYQLAPGATEPTLVVSGPSKGNSDCSDLESVGSYWNAGIAFDKWNNLYVTDRYGSSVKFCRVPYNASSGSWNFSTSDIWNVPANTVKGVVTPISPQDLYSGDDGVTFYMSSDGSTDTYSIYKYTVDQSGAVTAITPLITNLFDDVTTVVADHAGNVFFIENAYDAPSKRVTGIREIPAGTATIVGDGTGSAESALLRVDPAGAGFNGIKGLTFDAQGNLYFSSENNPSYGGQVNGVFMIPNEGTPTAPNLVWADTIMISPVGSGFPVLIDPRGFLWIPTGGSGNWAPPGTVASPCSSTNVAGCTSSSVVLWKPGAVNVGASPVGTANTAQGIYYSFSQQTTPSAISLIQPTGNNFVIGSNPDVDTSVTPPIEPCTAGTTYPTWSGIETNSAQYSWCTVWLQVNTQTTGNVGAELQMLDSSNKVIEGSNVYVGGIGQGAATSVLAQGLAVTEAIAKGLNTPNQVAADALGNSYVADSALKAVEKFPAGTTSPVVGTAIGTSLTAPTGVAVDGAGDVYIGDSGKVIEVPYIGGKLATAQQTTLLIGLGSHLNLATDAAGDVFVADHDKKQVVEVSNPQTSLLLTGGPTLTLGAEANFSGPSAIATDNSGNVWVADGSNLWEISLPFGSVSEAIAGGLQAPVTGLAVDPSGSVFVTDASGVLWIPYDSTTGSLNLNGVLTVASGFGTNNSEPPISVALDGSENAYVSYGSASTAGVTQVTTNGTVDFDNYGEVNPNVPFEADIQLFNLGNMPLTPAAFSGDVATDPEFTVADATNNSPACDPSVSTPAGGSCYLGLFVTASAAAQINGSIPILSNATNALAGTNLALSALAVTDFRFASQTAVAITPTSTSGGTFPGAETIVVTVTSSGGTPTGSIRLSVSSKNGSLPQQTVTLDGTGTATFTYSSLPGGTYSVNALYGGDGTAGASQNTCSPSGSLCFAGSSFKTTFTIQPAAAAFVVGQPGNQNCLTWTGSPLPPATNNCTPNSDNITSWAGNTYVNLGQNIWFTATVTSTLGTPGGTVTFELPNGMPADPTQGVNGAIAPNGNGVVNFSTSNLATGAYTLTAVYSGDQNFATQKIVLPTFYVIVPSVQVTATPAAVTTKAGTPVTDTLTLAPLVGFSSTSNPVSMKCIAATMPQFAECTFAYVNSGQGIVDVGTNGPTPSSIVVTISTNVPVNGGVSASVNRAAPWSLAGVFGLGLLGLIAGRKKVNRYLTLICFAAMLSCAFMGMTSCTNAGYSNPPKAPVVNTPPGTYNVQIITYNPTTLQQNSLTTPTFTLPVTVN